MLWRRTCGRSPLQLVIVRGPLQEFLLSHRSLIRMLISGMRVRCTGIPTVIEVQEPRAAGKESQGDGPVSVPPTLSGSSPFRRCRPAALCCAKVSFHPKR
jgi:hypothetical protein